MPTFTIPTIYTAVDKYSANVKNMEKATASFGSRLETIHARSERLFRKLTPGFSEATKQMAQMAGSAALVGGAIAGVVFSGKSIMDFETEIANLSAITGTSGKSLEVFKSKINEVALSTKESAVEVAKAFTQIGNNAPQLLNDADGLAEVTKQSIILAQAAKMELAPAADALTTIMNQFNKPAKEAKSVIDLLAGGMVIGSTDIDKVADAMTRFGGVASQVAGISLQESVTAIEAISDKMKDAEKIGTQFKNIFLKMSSISVQDPKALKDMRSVGINMKLIESKTVPLVEKLKELKKLMNVKGGLEHVFGTENLQSLIPLLSSTDKYSSMLTKLTTNEDAKNAAQKMADKNNDTLSKKLDQLKNKWVNLLVSSDGANNGLNKIKDTVSFVIEHLSEIVSVGIGVIKFFAAWKALNIAMNGLMLISNIRLGVSNALKLESIALLEGNIIATRVSIITEKLWAASMWVSNMAVTAWTAVLGYATSAQIALNVAMVANPIGLIVIAVAALAAGIGYLIYQNKMLTEEYKKNVSDKTIKTLNSEEKSVNRLAERYEKLGMSKKDAFSSALNFEKKEVSRQRLEVETKIKTMPYNDERVAQEALAKDLAIQNQSLTQIQVDYQKELINPKEAQANANATASRLQEQKGELKVTFENAPLGTKVEPSSNSMNIRAAVTSTMVAAH